jgi:hypothetical protein
VVGNLLSGGARGQRQTVEVGQAASAPRERMARARQQLVTGGVGRVLREVSRKATLVSPGAAAAGSAAALSEAPPPPQALRPRASSTALIRDPSRVGSMGWNFIISPALVKPREVREEQLVQES